MVLNALVIGELRGSRMMNQYWGKIEQEEKKWGTATHPICKKTLMTC